MEFILLVALVLLMLFFLNSFVKRGTRQALKRYKSQFDQDKSIIKLQPIRSKVAGVRYTNDDTGVERQRIIAKVKPGEDLILKPDKRNKHDSAAVKVCRLNGNQIGFLDTDLALEIHARLKDGSRVDTRVISVNDNGGYKDVEIELQKYSRRVKE